MRLLPLVFLLALACNTARRYEWDIQRERGHGDAGWARTIDDKVIRVETQGDDLFVQHGELYFLFKDVPAFEGRYSYYIFDLLGERLNAFYSPEGLTVRYRGGFEHWPPEKLPPNVKIVVAGADIRLEGLPAE